MRKFKILGYLIMKERDYELFVNDCNATIRKNADEYDKEIKKSYKYKNAEMEQLHKTIGAYQKRINELTHELILTHKSAKRA